MVIVTCIAPVNIAVIKYWGKRDEQLILPLNDSISATLSTDQMHAKTTIMASPEFKTDRMWLNGVEESPDSPRLRKCLDEIRKRATDKKQLSWKVHICSENNFPTAAGLASSAAGYACLVYALSKVYKLDSMHLDISKIARLGSGSACRSVIGGFVRWHRGSQPDGSDSFAEQIVPASHWPSLKVIILVVNNTKKKVSSTTGMQRSVETSELLKHRVSHVVPQRTQEMIDAIQNKDFHRFAELTMKDSNQFHSVCLDTFPPAVYMNDVSHAILEFVHAYNKSKGLNKLAYTFDAGANAVLFLEAEHVPEVLSLITMAFPPLPSEKNYIRGLNVDHKSLQKELSLPSGPHEAGLLKYIINTEVGPGPSILDGDGVHLLNDQGLPIKADK